jgi:hypothetical protein
LQKPHKCSSIFLMCECLPFHNYDLKIKAVMIDAVVLCAILHNVIALYIFYDPKCVPCADKAFWCQ